MCTTEIGAGTFLFVNTNDLNVHIGEMYIKLKDDKKICGVVDSKEGCPYYSII